MSLTVYLTLVFFHVFIAVAVMVCAAVVVCGRHGIGRLYVRRSTSDDYGSDYEDGGTEYRWRDESETRLRQQRRVHQRRSYCVSRRRRHVARSQSDSVPVTGRRHTADADATRGNCSVESRRRTKPTDTINQ